MKNNNVIKNKAVNLVVVFALFFLQTNFIYASTALPQSTALAQGAVLPEGEVTVNGTTKVVYSGNTLDVTTSNKSINNWNSFSIGQAGTVNFIQPSSSSVSLNRVTGVDPSSILGALNANGRIFLVNPNGVFFGAGSQVNVSGLLASTADISNSNFLAGNYAFTQTGKGSIVNQGNINIANGGYVALLSSEGVNNTGMIVAPLGQIVLATGKTMTVVGLDDNKDISVAVSTAGSGAIQNSGLINAQGGRVLLTANVLKGLLANAVNNSGVVEANSLVNNNGTIEIIAAGGDITSTSGSVISTKATDTTAQGGSITINSTNDVNIQKGAVLDVSGGSKAGNGGHVALIAQGNLDFQGTVNGYAAKGYSMGTANLDPLNADVSGAFNANTTVWASNDVFITGATTIGSGVNLNIFADNTSGAAGAWGLGVGSITDTGNYTISALVAGSGVLNFEAGSGGIGSSNSPILVSGLGSFSAIIDPSAKSGDIAISNSGATPLLISPVGVSTPNGNVFLTSTSGIQQAGSINANSLLAEGSGFFALNDQYNNINTFAADVTGPLVYNQINAVTLGLVGGVNGVNTNGGAVSVYSNGAINAGNINTSGGNLLLQALGNVQIGNVNAGAGNAVIYSNGDITGTPSNTSLIGNSLTLDAVKGISGLDTQASTIFADVFGSGGDINIDNVSSKSLTLTAYTNSGSITLVALGNINVDAIDVGNGDASLKSSTGSIGMVSPTSLISGNLVSLDSSTGTNATTNTNYVDADSNGAININNTSNNPVLFNAQSNGNITFKTLGNLLVGTTLDSAPNSDTSLESVNGYINNGTNTSMISGYLVSLDSATGTNVTTNTSILDADGSAEISINNMASNAVLFNAQAVGDITLLGNNITLNNVLSTSGNVVVHTLSGDITLQGLTKSTNGYVDLNAYGSLDAIKGSEVQAAATSVFAAGGTMGSAANPVYVDMAGNLILNIGSEINGDSGFLMGIVNDSSSGVPIVANSTPGSVYFNGVLI